MDPFVALGMLVASLLITSIFTPKQQPPQPTAFEDIDFPQKDEGTPQVVVFGDCWVSDWTVLGVGNYRTTAIKTKSGKK